MKTYGDAKVICLVSGNEYTGEITAVDPKGWITLKTKQGKVFSFHPDSKAISVKSACAQGMFV